MALIFLVPLHSFNINSRLFSSAPPGHSALPFPPLCHGPPLINDVPHRPPPGMPRSKHAALLLFLPTDPLSAGHRTMWLLRTHTAELKYFPRNFHARGGYAILSHTWEGAE